MHEEEEFRDDGRVVVSGCLLVLVMGALLIAVILL